MTTSSLIPVLASAGDSGYLYGLFFLIVALIIGAATRHFLQRIPLPFTVLLLLIGLAMGGLNRAYGPHGGHAHGDSHAAEQAPGLWNKFVDTLSGAISWGGNLDGHLILYVFLPILIFEAGFALDVHTFKKSFLNAFYLAGPGIVTATVMTGFCFHGADLCIWWIRRSSSRLECGLGGIYCPRIDAFWCGRKCDRPCGCCGSTKRTWGEQKTRHIDRRRVFA